MKTNVTLKQKQLIPSKEVGSFINMLMSNNSSVPEVGKGATVIKWSDRSAYEVISVSDDLKTVVIQKYEPERIDGLGMSEMQEYKYEKLVDYTETIVWRYGAWRKKVKTVVFDDTYNYLKSDRAEIYNEDGTIKLVEGKTKPKTEYFKINIIFGVKDEYYDFSF